MISPRSFAPAFLFVGFFCLVCGSAKPEYPAVPLLEYEYECRTWIPRFEGYFEEVENDVRLALNDVYQKHAPDYGVWPSSVGVGGGQLSWGWEHRITVDLRAKNPQAHDQLVRNPEAVRIQLGSQLEKVFENHLQKQHSCLSWLARPRKVGGIRYELSVLPDWNPPSHPLDRASGLIDAAVRKAFRKNGVSWEEAWGYQTGHGSEESISMHTRFKRGNPYGDDNLVRMTREAIEAVAHQTPWLVVQFPDEEPSRVPTHGILAQE